MGPSPILPGRCCHATLLKEWGGQGRWRLASHDERCRCNRRGAIESQLPSWQARFHASSGKRSSSLLPAVRRRCCSRTKTNIRQWHLREATFILEADPG